MNQDFWAVLEYMEKEKGIDRKTMLAAVEAALVSAFKKSFGPAKNVRINLNPKNGKIEALALYRVVDQVRLPDEEMAWVKARQRNPQINIGDTIEIEVTPKDFGRIAAQVFRQTINQNIRSIEKGMILNEFKDREGDIVSGTVRRFEKSDVIVDLGKFEAVMPSKERIATEEYNVGDRVLALIMTVDDPGRGSGIILSRSHPNLVRKLLEREVPELHDGTIEIKGIVREPGYLTKVAVWSKDPKIDPVGACVGMRGARVKNVMRELGAEKIAFANWSPNIQEFILEALKPAKVKRIEMDHENKEAKILVDEDNLASAIGRRGQNARLAASLTGWKIEVEREQKPSVFGFEQKMEQAAQRMSDALELDLADAQAVVRAGFASVDDLVEQTEEDLQQALPEMSSDKIQQIHLKALAFKQAAGTTGAAARSS